jgi:hypothetical protein
MVVELILIYVNIIIKNFIRVVFYFIGYAKKPDLRI